MSDKASQPEVCAAPAESTELDDPAATQNRDMRGGAYLPLFDVIKTVLGIHERCRFDSTPDGARIYGLIERRRRDGLKMPVRTHTDENDGRVRTYYCLRDVIVLVRRELPDVLIAEDKIWLLEKEIVHLESKKATTPGEWDEKHKKIAFNKAEIINLKYYGYVSELHCRIDDDDPERIDAWKRYAIKIPRLERERKELSLTIPPTPSESKLKRKMLDEVDRGIAELKEHVPIAEPPAQTAKPTAAEAAPRKPRARPRKKAAASPLPD